ncbi:DUF6946 family protein [Paracoccus liaowanqingii]|uniref:DUF6946 family protein n=1 Tax=Paracoccus liaowanqingii TaxID=2560053 RepID=UPI002680D491
MILQGVPVDRQHQSGLRLDLAGTVVSAASLSSCALSMTLGDRFEVLNWLLLATTAAGMIQFLRVEARSIVPLVEPPRNLRYQLFHRTAAAIIEADRMNTGAAAMIVQSFSQEHRWFEDFAAFCAFLGLRSERSVPLVRQLPDGQDLIIGWATRNPQYFARRVWTARPVWDLVHWWRPNSSELPLLALQPVSMQDRRGLPLVFPGPPCCPAPSRP